MKRSSSLLAATSLHDMNGVRLNVIEVMCFSSGDSRSNSNPITQIIEIRDEPDDISIIMDVDEKKECFKIVILSLYLKINMIIIC